MADLARPCVVESQDTFMYFRVYTNGDGFTPQLPDNCLVSATSRSERRARIQKQWSSI
jgi:hypothetical protein